MKYCYQCDATVTYLFADARCGKCTRTDPQTGGLPPEKYDEGGDNEANVLDIIPNPQGENK